jgi:nitroreductase
MAHPKHARPDHDILDVIRKRWSPRAFDPARDVPRSELLRLFEAARWAPSSLNEQPWRFVMASRTTSPSAFDAMFGTLTERNRGWAHAAPVLTLVAVHRTIEQFDGMENIHAWYDAGQAVAFLTLQATAQGLSLRQMEGFDRDRAREVCAVPEPFEPAVMIAIGYVGSPDALSVEKHRAAEQQPRARRPISDFVFEGIWGCRLRDNGPHD